MEQPPYIQHSLVISKLPYLPPPNTRGCVLHHVPIRARVYALLLLVGFRAQALHLMVGCGQNQGAWHQPVERVEPDYTVIQPSRVWRVRRDRHPPAASSHPDSVCISTVVIYGSSQAQYSLITQVPKLCKSFKNSFLVNMFTLLTVFRCPKCPYL